MRSMFPRGCLALTALLLSAACSPSAPDGGGMSGPDAPGAAGASQGGQGGPGTSQGGQGGAAAQGGQGGQGGTGGQGGRGPGGFLVRGQIARASASVGLARALGPAEGPGPDGPKTVTHVLAVTPSSLGDGRVLAPVGDDGSFALDLDPSRLWVLVFVDATRSGADMIAGVFRAEGGHALAPMRPGGADLGAIEVGEGGATTGMPYDELLAALGLDPAAALLLGRHDDLCLRVVNPDVDGNGELDVLEQGKRFLLDFHVGFGLRQGGQAVVLGDMVGQFLPPSLEIDYRRTGVYAAFPAWFAPGDWRPSRWAEFDSPLTFAPPASPGSPPPPDRTASLLGAGDLFVDGWGEMSTLGVTAVPGADLPQGTYRFGFADRTLTFTNVATRSDEELRGAQDFLMPFIKLAPADAACERDCALAGVEYEWRKRVEGGWVPATEAEVAVLAAEGGGYLSFLVDNDREANGGLALPRSPIAGSLPWSSVRAYGGPAAAERVAAATTDHLCHVGLSHDDKIGMRYFGDIQDGPSCGASSGGPGGAAGAGDGLR